MARRITFLGLLVSTLVWSFIALAQVSGGTLSIKGPLAAKDVRALLGAKTGAFEACLAARRKAGADPSGRVTFTWTVQSDGKVTRLAVAADKSTLTDDVLAGCLKGHIQGVSFARAATESTITYTLEIRAAADKGKGDGRKTETRDAEDSPRTKPKEPPADASGGRGTRSDDRDSLAEGMLGLVDEPGGSGKDYTPPKKKKNGGSHPATPVVPEPEATAGVERDREEGGGYVPSTPVATAPAMKAGRHDDNKQYNRFLEFLRDHAGLIPQPVDVSERIVIKAVDKDGKSLHNCKVEVSVVQGKKLRQATTYADGSTHFFPRDAAAKDQNDFTAAVTCGSATKSGNFNRDGKRELDLAFDLARTLPASVPVDVAIVLDTTGSMGGQIDRLRQTLSAIHLQLLELPAKPDLRFALVAYRDQGDEYVTRVTPFSKDVKAFQTVLNGLTADGGGDTPEDLQEALRVAVKQLDWRSGAVRLGFVVADAIPHTDYKQEYDYRKAMRESLERGIKWSMVGAGGLPVNGEVIFRQIAQYTMGEYVFVTQGEQRDSDGGAGEASHHVGTNYSVENLDQAIVRIVRRELSHLTNTPRDFDYTIVATGPKATPRDKILAPAVQEVLRQLTDYCAIRLEAKTPVAVVPVDSADAAYKGVGEYLSEQLVLLASRKGELRVVERDLRAVAQEQKLQLSDLFEAQKTVEFGKLVGAELLIVSRLTVRGEVGELYAKLLRVETGEILSAAKVEFKGGVLAGS